MKKLLASLLRTAAERLDRRRTVDEQWHLDSVAATNRYVERSERFIALLERQVRRAFVKTARDQTGHVAANDETRYPGGVLGELKRADLDAIMAREQIKADVIARLLDPGGKAFHFGADFAGKPSVSAVSFVTGTGKPLWKIPWKGGPKDLADLVEAACTAASPCRESPSARQVVDLDRRRSALPWAALHLGGASGPGSNQQQQGGFWGRLSN